MLAERIATWRYILANTNLPQGATLDVVSKWLVITRASVFSMTLTSGLIGGLPAGRAPRRGPPLRGGWGLPAATPVRALGAPPPHNISNPFFALGGGGGTDE